MNRASGLAALNTVISSGIASRSSIARGAGVHPSQVSRIAAGHFKKLDGHALRVCKFAQNLIVAQAITGAAPVAQQAEALREKMLELVSAQPDVAVALATMLDAMLGRSSA